MSSVLAIRFTFKTCVAAATEYAPTPRTAADLAALGATYPNTNTSRGSVARKQGPLELSNLGYLHGGFHWLGLQVETDEGWLVAAACRGFPQSRHATREYT